MRASDIAAAVGGTIDGQERGADPEITGVAPLDRAGPTELSFLAHPRYSLYVAASRAGAVLVSEAMADRATGSTPRIRVRDVHRALTVVLPLLYPESRPDPGVHPTAVLGRGVELGEDVLIGAYAVIGAGSRVGARTRIGSHCVLAENCTLGTDVLLHPHVTLYARSWVGDRSILHSGVRVGTDGFGYAFVEGGHRKVPQVGTCVIGADVEIGANTTIDRGSIGPTEIGNGVKIDNLVQIGHNVRVGENCIIVAQVGIAGSTVIGQGVVLAGQAGISGHLRIGDGARIGAQAGVIKDVPAGAEYSDY
ncbi:MAG: UDP-3-O-(3-hydroxymyristoyl)glucosamine N-acyltransferase, partial [Longimicrobiales bacterium]